MSRFQAAIIDTAEQMEAALDIRRKVFIQEQGVPEDMEIDEQDAHQAWGRTAVHALLTAEGRPVATGRLLLEQGPRENAHIGRVAVLADQRRQGAGRALMEALQDEARRRGYRGVTLAAQLHAVGFYQGLGYVARGEVFLDAGIDHLWMDLEL